MYELVRRDWNGKVKYIYIERVRERNLTNIRYIDFILI